MQCKIASLAALVLAGCAANPQPIPLPKINDQALYLSGSEKEDYILAGLPGAVSEAAGTDVVVLNLARGTSHRAAAADDGSFLVSVTRAATDKLEVWSEQGDRVSPRVAVRMSDVSPPIPPGPLTVGTVSPSSGGKVTVTGTAGTNVVVVGNQARGSSQSGSVDPMGRWSISLAAAAGDRLIVFQVDSASLAASAPIQVQVPP